MVEKKGGNYMSLEDGVPLALVYVLPIEDETGPSFLLLCQQTDFLPSFFLIPYSLFQNSSIFSLSLSVATECSPGRQLT